MTLVYSNIIYRLGYLRDKMTFYLRETRRLFDEDLCFVDDPCNADVLAGGKE